MDELFSGVYSPPHVRFFLLHWDALEGLAEWPSSARAVLSQLTREWELLDEARYDHLDCLCDLLNDGVPSREPLRIGSGYLMGTGPLCIETTADLSKAADALPYHWQATRHIYTLQNRPGQWKFRFGVATRSGARRPQDRLIEPRSDPLLEPLRTGGGAAAVRMMARSLGWRSAPATAES